MRLVIELKRGEVPEVVLNNLYKQTQLQDTFGINMVALVDGQPKLCNLKDLISVFLQHRREVVTRRTVFTLRKARERGHVPRRPGRGAGQHRRLHRHHPQRAHAAGGQGRADGRPGTAPGARDAHPRPAPTAAWSMPTTTAPKGLTAPMAWAATACTACRDTQAQEILQMRLQRLTGLEQDKIVAEYKDVMAEIEDLLDILARPERVSTIIGEELTAHPPSSARPRARPQRDRAQRAGPEHRGPDHAHRHGGHAERTGYIKSQPLAEYRAQKAAARQAGHRHQRRRLDRPALHRQHARLHPVLSNRGRLYWLKVWEVPQGSRGSRGRPSSTCSRCRKAKDQRRAAADRRSAASPRTSMCSWPPAWAR